MSVKCGSCGAENDGWVPQERLDKVSAQRREALEDVRKLQGEIGDLHGTINDQTKKLSTVDSLSDALDSYRAKEGQWELQRGLMQAGITEEEGLAVASTIYGALPAEDRPSVADWLASDQLPKGVRSYLPSSEPAPAPAAPAAPAEPVRQPLPRSNVGAQPAPAPAPDFSPGSIRGMSAADYEANREAILAKFRGR